MKSRGDHFDEDAWLSDTALSLCKPATRGIWMDAICHMRKIGKDGTLTGRIEDLARLCRCSADEMRDAIIDLKVNNAADVTGDVTGSKDGVVTLKNRRMSRQCHDRAKLRERKRLERAKKGVSRQCHADVTPDVTPMSQQHVTGDVTPMSHEQSSPSSPPLSPPSSFSPTPPLSLSPSYSPITPPSPRAGEARIEIDPQPALAAFERWSMAKRGYGLKVAENEARAVTDLVHVLDECAEIVHGNRQVKQWMLIPQAVEVLLQRRTDFRSAKWATTVVRNLLEEWSRKGMPGNDKSKVRPTPVRKPVVFKF